MAFLMREIKKGWSKTSFEICNPSPKNEKMGFAPQVSRLSVI